MRKELEAALAKGGNFEPFEAVFGRKPRVKLVEALLRLRGLSFSRSEWAAEAGLTRATTLRVMSYFERLGFVSQKKGGRVPEYEANATSPALAELGRMYHSLDLALKGHDVDAIRSRATGGIGPRSVRVKLGASASKKVSLPTQTETPRRVFVDSAGVVSIGE